MSRKTLAPFRSGMGLFFLITIGLAGSLSSSCYLTKQASALLEQRSKAIPFEVLLKADDLKPEIRTLIERVEKIRQFGIEEIGLKDSDNYRSLVEIPQDYLVTVVSACRPLAFDSHTWWFPFFGSSPYLGFFDDKDAIEEAKKLKSEGWETWVRHVDAFSTLGILKDPLFSFMSSYSEYRLANLVMHEQTHATIWSAGHFDFNEQLATFLGDWCALTYVGAVYGTESPEYQMVGNQDADQKRFYADLATLRSRLMAIYDSKQSDMEKTGAKEECLKQWQTEFGLSYATNYRTPDYAGLSSLTINNAFLDLYKTYTGRGELFQTVFEQAGGARQFIAMMKQAASASDPFAWMEKMVASHSL